MHTIIRRLIWPTILALALGVAVVALSQAFDDDLLATTTMWVEAFNAGDAAGVSALYHPDATWVNTAGAVFTGIAEVEHVVQAIRGAGIVGIRVDPTDIRRDETITYNVGRYTFITADGGEIPGHYVVITVLEHGEWLIIRHMATAIEPPEPAE